MTETPKIKFKHAPKALIIKALHTLMTPNQEYTQKELHRLLSKELNKGSEHYKASQNRMRHIAATVIEIKIKTRCGIGKRPPKNDICPICNVPMSVTKNKTLDTNPVEIGYKCYCCGYWTDKDARRIPKGYKYIYKA